MKATTKKILNQGFIVFNIFIILLYSLVCLVPLLSDGKFWFIAMLGLLFPVLFVFVVVFLVIWLVKKSRLAFLPLAALLMSFQQLSVLIAPRLEKKFNTDKQEGTISILNRKKIRFKNSLVVIPVFKY